MLNVCWLLPIYCCHLRESIAPSSLLLSLSLTGMRVSFLPREKRIENKLLSFWCWCSFWLISHFFPPFSSFPVDVAAEVNRPRKDMEMTPRKEIGCCRMRKGKRRRQTWRKARREGKREKLEGSKRENRLDRKCMNMYGMDGVMVWKTERSDGEWEMFALRQSLRVISIRVSGVWIAKSFGVKGCGQYVVLPDHLDSSNSNVWGDKKGESLPRIFIELSAFCCSHIFSVESVIYYSLTHSLQDWFVCSLSLFPLLAFSPLIIKWLEEKEVR